MFKGFVPRFAWFFSAIFLVFFGLALLKPFGTKQILGKEACHEAFFGVINLGVLCLSFNPKSNSKGHGGKIFFL